MTCPVEPAMALSHPLSCTPAPSLQYQAALAVETQSLASLPSGNLVHPCGKGAPRALRQEPDLGNLGVCFPHYSV